MAEGRAFRGEERQSPRLAAPIRGKCVLHTCSVSFTLAPTQAQHKPALSTWVTRGKIQPGLPLTAEHMCAGDQAQTTELRGDRHIDPSPCHRHRHGAMHSKQVSSSCPGVRPSGLKPTLGERHCHDPGPSALSILGQYGRLSGHRQSFSPRGQMAPGRAVLPVTPDVLSALHVYTDTQAHMHFLRLCPTTLTLTSYMSTQTPFPRAVFQGFTFPSRVFCASSGR